MAEVAITGMGLVTPLGCDPGEILERIMRGEKAIRPAPFASSLACRVFAPVVGFDAARHFPENKTLRLMNRDAQMAVVAARLAKSKAEAGRLIEQGGVEIDGVKTTDFTAKVVPGCVIRCGRRRWCPCRIYLWQPWQPR